MKKTISAQPLQLDIFSAREKRDSGMQQALEHANEVVPEWAEMAYNFLIKWLKTHTDIFFIEDVRKDAEESKEVPLPPSNRAWGPVVVRAAKNGKVKRKGYGQVKNDKAHCTPASIWIKI